MKNAGAFPVASNATGGQRAGLETTASHVFRARANHFSSSSHISPLLTEGRRTELVRIQPVVAGKVEY